MTMPTFADAEAAIAARDYRAALSILEALDVVGEDACYRRDIQAAACADRLPHHAAPRAHRADQCLEGCRHRRPVLRTLLPVRRPWSLSRCPMGSLRCLGQLISVAAVFPGARWGVFLLYVAAIVSVYFYVGHQIATFNRTLPRGVRLTFMRVCTRFTELGGRAFLFMRISLIAFMNGIG